MSRLRRRLSHVKAPPEAEASSAPALAERTDRRRARMAALEGALTTAVRRAGVTVTPRAPGSGRLPFEQADGCHVRSVRFDDDARIGRIAVGLVRRADRSMLAQLALTPALAEVDLDRLLFLDTETTGLGGGTGNFAFLVGLAFSDGEGFRLEQLFCAEPGDEPAVLERVAARLGRASAVVSFNGKSFDMPVLRARFVMNGLPPPAERPQLDLLHLVRRIHKGRSWRKTLGRLEAEVLGYRRGTDVAGEEVAHRYRHFLRTGDASGIDEVVRHNERDVWSLVALAGFYGSPLSRLDAVDLPWAARTLRRAGDLGGAGAIASLAVERRAGPEALRARGEIAKAAGDRALALEAFEAADEEAGDAFVRLELAKLYEHHARDPARALAVLERGLAEPPAAVDKRRHRLLRKLHR